MSKIKKNISKAEGGLTNFSVLDNKKLRHGIPIECKYTTNGHSLGEIPDQPKPNKKFIGLSVLMMTILRVR